MKELPKGTTCKCGKFNAFDMWVYAHWDIVLHHKCDCGVTTTVLAGRVLKQIGKPKKVKSA